MAPAAQTVCSQGGSAVNLNDFANRPPRGLAADEVFSTGKYRFRFRPTPHLPHGWDAGVFFEETQRTLFCLDLFHQNGDVEPITESDIVERARQALIEYQGGLLDGLHAIYTENRASAKGSGALQPKTLAAMHGSTFVGDGAQALHDLGRVMREVYGEGSEHT